MCVSNLRETNCKLKELSKFRKYQHESPNSQIVITGFS